MCVRGLLLFSLPLLVACPPPSGEPEPAASSPQVAPAAPAPATPPGPEMVLATRGGASVQEQVRAALASTDGRRLVVYVGATWCEPCRRFHDAVEAGQLDEQLAGVRFLEFDHDAHHDGLEVAGYLKRFVPVFAIPQPDGRASSRIHQGAVKGPGAVDFILPRLEALLSQSPL